MKKQIIIITLALVLALSLAGAGGAQVPPLMERRGPAKTEQTACPVMGGRINKELYVDYQGQRIYFCCPACIDIFKNDPEKFLQKLREQGVVPEKSPSGK